MPLRIDGIQAPNSAVAAIYDRQFSQSLMFDLGLDPRNPQLEM
jgi:hypothetical protein